MDKFQIISNSETVTKNIAKDIANEFHNGDIILLDGELGAGKTYFVKGFALGYNCLENVTSPTFSIANFYETEDITLLHIDLYRIESIEEFYDLGLFEYFENSIVLIEWGNKFADYFEDFISIFIEHIEGKKHSRSLTFSTHSSNYTSKIEIINQKLSKFV